MPLLALLAEPLEADSRADAEAFLGGLRQPQAEVRAASRGEIAATVAACVGLDDAERVAIDPGSVTLLAGGEGEEPRPVMVNIRPGDPLGHRDAAGPRGPRLHLVRHGEADTPDAEGRLHSHAPLPLTARGRSQAAALRRAFAPIEAAVVHASDIARTAETARALAGERPVCLHAGLRELSLGELEGAHADEVLAAAPGFLLDPDATLPGGESLRELGVRAGAALDRILAAEPDRDLIVVAHGGVNRALLGRLLEIPLERALRIRQDWAGVNVLEWTGSAWAVGALNWTPAGLAELDRAQRTARLHERDAPDRG